MSREPSPKDVSTKQRRIAQLAEQMPGVGLTTLAHHIDIEWLREAYRRTRKDGAAGVDGQTAAEYAANLEANLQSLLDRAKAGDPYRAPPVRRVHIPKDGGKTRPIGIPTFETKSCRGRSSWRWSRSMSTTSCHARTASGQGEVHTTRWKTCAEG